MSMESTWFQHVHCSNASLRQASLKTMTCVVCLSGLMGVKGRHLLPRRYLFVTHVALLYEYLY